jgi:hypothetical protein
METVMFDWDHGGGGGGDSDFEWNLDVEYNFNLDVTVEFDTTVDYESNYNVDPEVNVCVDIDGNWAGFQVDVQAIGEDTATEVNLAVITLEDEYSSITLTGYSAVG